MFEQVKRTTALGGGRFHPATQSTALPFQGDLLVDYIFPGRCPGLETALALRAEDQTNGLFVLAYFEVMEPGSNA